MGNGWQLIEEPYRTASVLIAGDNFGSSAQSRISTSMSVSVLHKTSKDVDHRENMRSNLGIQGTGPVRERMFSNDSLVKPRPWALNDQGIRCIIAPSFADIFFNKQTWLLCFSWPWLDPSLECLMSPMVSKTSLCSTHNIVRKSATCEDKECNFEYFDISSKLSSNGTAQTNSQTRELPNLGPRSLEHHSGFSNFLKIFVHSHPPVAVASRTACCQLLSRRSS